ncbi:MAG: hypothetical protein VB068_14050 [Petrimonas sp.]|nr:hypothetical protein [Petrimonas sp.]
MERDPKAKPSPKARRIKELYLMVVMKRGGGAGMAKKKTPSYNIV